MLLKLILDWVEQHQLQKRRVAAAAAIQNPNPNPNFFNFAPDPNSANCFPSPWTPQTPMYPMGGGYDPYSTPYPSTPMTPYPNSGGEYHQGMDPAWGMMMMQPQPQPQLNHYHYHHPDNHQQADVYGSPYPKLESLGPAATKEARRRRMDHQRRVQHHHPYRHNNVRVDDVGENVKIRSAGGRKPASAGGTQPPSQSTGASDRRHLQAEQNLKLLLQKVLKQSDVGNLGRIVLPKKEAETHLPELDTRDGITIPMEDIGTSRVWNMRYRFWPNNKSRMYLLENTGDFVRVNGLQEGDFIVLYSDTKCGKYMIRGVKVPELGTKLESKKATKRTGRNLSLAGGMNSSLPGPNRKAAS